MSTQTPAGLESVGTTDDEPTITGPHVGFDRFGNPDHEYWRCERCGDEAIRRRDLEGHDCPGGR